MGFDNCWLAEKLSRRYQPTDTHGRVDWYLYTAPRKRFISWVFLTVPHLFYQTLRKSHETIFVGHFSKIPNTCERCFRDVSEMSQHRHVFLRYFRDVLKTSHKRYRFWDIFEMSQRRHKIYYIFWDVFQTY